MKLMKSIIAAAWLLPAVAFGAPSVSKLGIVDVRQVMETSKEAISISQRLESEFKGQEKELRAKEAAFQTARTKYEKEADFMSDAERSEIEHELIAIQEDYQRMQFELNEAVSKRHQAEMKQFMEKLKGVIDTYAESEDFDVLLPSDMSLYFKSPIDVTDSIIKKMDQESV